MVQMSNHVHYVSLPALVLALFAAGSPHDSLAAENIGISPEPANFVRICDAYGTGFFFIPGTETCMRFSGFIRSSYEKVNIDGTFDGQPGNTLGLSGWTNRARLNIDTRNETDFGTLRALFRLEGGDFNTDVNVDMDVALISLAGFRAGFTGINYWNSNADWANFSGIGTVGISDEGFLSFDDATIFDYTFMIQDLAITIGVEDPRLDLSSLTIGAGGGGNETNNGTTAGEVNFYAGFNYESDFGAFYFTAVHDSLATENLDPLANPSNAEGGWAYRANVTVNLDTLISGGKLVGQYSYDGKFRTAYVTTDGVTYDPEAIWAVAFEADLSDELQFVAQYSHVKSDEDEAEGSAFNAGVGINWFPVSAPGFSLRGSYFFGEVENSLGLGATGATVATATRASYDYDGFFVGARRDF
ncbi:MAG: porin [Pseudomonadota bacterium]